MLLRFKAGTIADSETKLRAFLAANGCSDASCLLADSRPPEIDGYRNASNLPLAIGVVLGLFLVATLVHALVSTMRRRTSDLAVLRALGCTRRQLAATLRWQGLMLTVSAIVIGIPVGLIASRFAWSAFASHVGIASDTTSPIAILVVGTGRSGAHHDPRGDARRRPRAYCDPPSPRHELGRFSDLDRDAARPSPVMDGGYGE